MRQVIPRLLNLLPAAQRDTLEAISAGAPSPGSITKVQARFHDEAVRRLGRLGDPGGDS